MLLFPAHLMERAVVCLAEVQPRFDPIDGLPLWGAVAIAGLGLLAIRVGLRAFAFFGWFALALLGAAPARHGPAIHAAPRVVFFDMGQGDAALVEGESGTILIDTGGGRSDDTGGGTLIRALRSLGITRLDVLVVTHGDLDHRAGAAQVMERLAVQELWLPAGGQDDDRLARLATQAERRHVSVRWLEAGAPGMDRGDLEVDILWPAPRPAPPPTPGRRSRGSLDLPSRRSRNEGSLVLRVGVAGTRILFAADIGSEVETRLIESSGLLDADVLKVAHHGSRNSTTSAFLAAVSPAYAVVSAPCDPARGLPNGRTLDRLARAGSSIWWTGRDGAVSLGLSPIRAELDFVGWGARRRCRGRVSAP
jgi:competence protein ComEC